MSIDPDAISVRELEGVRRRLRTLGHEIRDDDEALRGLIRLVLDRTPVPQPDAEKSGRLQEELDAIDAPPMTTTRLDAIMARFRMLRDLKRLASDPDTTGVKG